MTQSEVVGDFITRNMLSKIESGAAVPSLQTLNYLAKALDVPISQLVPSSEDAVEILNRCKQMISDKEYEKSIDLLEKLPSDLYDEYEALGAIANLGVAELLANNNEYRKAASYAQKAFEKSQIGIYASRDVQTKSLLLIDNTIQKLDIQNGLIDKYEY